MRYDAVLNAPPVADPQSVETDEDTSLPITLTGSDRDGDQLTFAIATSPSNGSLAGTPPSFTYTPNTNYGGPDSFNFTVDDGDDTSLPATVDITIRPVFDPASSMTGSSKAWSTPTRSWTAVDRAR